MAIHDQIAVDANFIVTGNEQADLFIMAVCPSQSMKISNFSLSNCPHPCR
jgi:hypothetical protein